MLDLPMRCCWQRYSPNNPGVLLVAMMLTTEREARTVKMALTPGLMEVHASMEAV